MSNIFSNVTVQQLKRAIKLKTKLETLQGELDGILGALGSAPSASTTKRGMSAAGRKRIALGQKKRWAKLKAKGVASSGKRQRRKMSPAARARIAASARARWAKVKAAGKNRL
jgi:hypothetical protein